MRISDWSSDVCSSDLDVAAAQTALETRLGRSPEDEEVAAEVGLTLRELRDLYAKVSFTSVASFDDSGPGLVDARAGLALEATEDEDTRRLLRSAINTLPERDQIIPALSYYDHPTFTSIAAVPRVTASQEDLTERKK